MDRYAYYALKRRVFDVSVVVGLLAGVTRRNLAHWLVKDRGFPWRNDCSVDDLNRLLAFLLYPDIVCLAESAPDYPMRGRPDDEDDDESLEPAQVHEVLVRHAAEEINLDQAVELLGPTFAAAAEEREYRDESDVDAFDVLEAARRSPLGERRHRVLFRALRAPGAVG